MGRKLASVQYAHDIWPIEGEDRIEDIVVCPFKPVYLPLLSALLSCKVINNDYLLKKP